VAGRFVIPAAVAASLCLCANSAHAQIYGARAAPRGDLPGYAERMFSVFPNTRIRYYPVYGNDAEAIRQSLNAYGLKNPTNGRAVDGLSITHIDWGWPTSENGGCDLGRMQLKFSATVILPRLVTSRSIDSGLARKWGQYMAALIEHEYGHVRQAYSQRAMIIRAIRNSPCGAAHFAGLSALDRVRRYDAAYDVETGHGATQGARFP
jgi:predicted secreted Zn-dependent protease